MKRPSHIYHEPRRLNPEERLQRAVVEFIQRAAPQLLFYACPNGGVSKGQNGRNKSMGVMAGAPDLHFVLQASWPANHNEIAYIELKAGKNGLSPAQKTFRAVCELRGIKWALCRSVEDVEATLRGWGVALKATTGARRAA